MQPFQPRLDALCNQNLHPFAKTGRAAAKSQLRSATLKTLLHSLDMVSKLHFLLIRRRVYLSGETARTTPGRWRMISEESKKIWEQLLPEILEGFPDIVFSLDTGGHLTFLGKKRGPFILNPFPWMQGKRIWECVVPEDAELAKTILKTRPDSVFDEELTIIDVQGNPRRIQLRCRPNATDTGKPLGFTGLMLEGKAREKLEQDLNDLRNELSKSRRTIEELQEHVAEGEKYRSVARHIAEVAHELKQSLAIIGGFTHRMAKKLGAWEKLDPDTQPECFSVIMRELRRLEDMLIGLIGISRRDTLHLEEVDLDNMIEAILNIYRETLSGKRLTIQRNYGLGRAEVILDSHLFEHVIRNLVINAIEASFEGGAIWIETSLVNADSEEKETEGVQRWTHFEFRIGNEGEPIPRDRFDQIFTPFFTTKSSGTGLGLTLAQHIVEEHRGSINVTSDWGGTVFAVRIPLDVTAQAYEKASGTGGLEGGCRDFRKTESGPEGHRHPEPDERR